MFDFGGRGRPVKWNKYSTSNILIIETILTTQIIYPAIVDNLLKFVDKIPLTKATIFDTM